MPFTPWCCDDYPECYHRVEAERSRPRHVDQVRAQAELEIGSERYRAAVEREKERIRTRKPWWFRIFPYVIRRREP